MKGVTALAAGGCLTLLLGGGVAYGVSFSSADAGGVIHGCLSKRSVSGIRMLTVRDTNRRCPDGMTGLDWNQQGPAGVEGSPGPAGPAAPAGPSTAGPPGLDVIIVSARSDIGVAVVECPASHPYAISGGGSAYVMLKSGAGLAPPAPISASIPVTDNGGSSPTGWGVDAVDQSGADGVFVSAECAK
jgi:hypothetical protein